MTSKLDSRQSILRNSIAQLGTGTAVEVDDILVAADAQIAKLYEDRNIQLVEGGTLSYATGSPSIFSLTATMKLHINSKVAGGSPVAITITGTSFNFSADGRMLYAVLNRAGGTATITSDSSTLPAVNAANLEVFLIAKRVDGVTQRIYLCNGQSLGNGESGFLGSAAVSPVFVDNTFQIIDNGDATKKIAFEASGIATATTRTITMPDANVDLGNLTNSNINASAAIARTKIASGSANQVIINDVTGVLTSEGQLAITRGGTGASTASAAFNALSPTTARGDLITQDAGGSDVRVAMGSTNFLLSNNGNDPIWTGTIAAGINKTGVSAVGSYTAGAVGEFYEVVRANSSTLALGSGVAANVTASSLGVGAGEWEFTATAGISGTATSVSRVIFSISTTSATNGLVDGATVEGPGTFSLAGQNYQHTLPIWRLGAGVYYLVAYCAFSGGTCNVWGRLQARRVR